MTTDPTVPRRVQRTRRAGQPGMPPGARYVGRGTRWGNPARVAPVRCAEMLGRRTGWTVLNPFTNRYGPTHRLQWLARSEAAAHYRVWLERHPDLAAAARAELAGRDLACWCPLPAPGEPDHCHAVALIQLANSAAEVAR